MFSQCEVQRSGCTDPSASNYDVAADYDDGSCVYGVDPGDDDQPDLEGNLYVTNETEEILYLYKDFALISSIPAKSTNFLINIPNPELAICKLQIWKASDVEDWNNPDIANVYRQWSVALSNTTLVNERANWLITDNDSYVGSGTLNLTYPSIDEYGQAVIYQVDVYLNSQEGAKIASLQPGISQKKVSVDYGVHYLYFHYWYSDPNSTTGEITDIGWDQENDVVINAGHTSADITIPFYSSNIGKYGELTVYNETSKAITIYADDALIESIAKLDGSTQGLSVIPAMNYTTFLIPVSTYSIIAKSIDGSSIIDNFVGIDILQDENAVLHAGVNLQSVSVINSTSENLLVCTPQGDYLGQFIKPGQSTSLFEIQDTITLLMVMTPDKLKSKIISAGTNVYVTELETQVSVDFQIITPWSISTDNVYQSTNIYASSSTSMIASLDAPKEVTISFDYKVSSELNYDYMSFSVDSLVVITKLSGEIDWTTYSIKVASGKHLLEWKYQKDSMIDGGSDFAQIRNIRIE